MEIYEIGVQITIPSFIYIYLLYFPLYGLFAAYRFDRCAVLTKSALCFVGPSLLAAVLWRYSKSPKLARLLYTNRGSFAMLFLAPCVPTEIRPVSKKIWKRTFLEMNEKN